MAKKVTSKDVQLVVDHLNKCVDYHLSLVNAGIDVEIHRSYYLAYQDSIGVVEALLL